MTILNRNAKNYPELRVIHTVCEPATGPSYRLVEIVNGANGVFPHRSVVALTVQDARLLADELLDYALHAGGLDATGA